MTTKRQSRIAEIGEREQELKTNDRATVYREYLDRGVTDLVTLDADPRAAKIKAELDTLSAERETLEREEYDGLTAAEQRQLDELMARRQGKGE